MIEPSNRRRLSLLGLAWLSLATIHVAMQVLVPRGIVADPLLPIWARVSLLATELASLALFLLLRRVGCLFVAHGSPFHLPAFDVPGPGGG